MTEQMMSTITDSVFLIIIYLISIAVHEMCHGYAAYCLGDPTAYNMGRLTLNPLKHIDPLGLLMVVVFRIGWARPVQINTRHFSHPRRDTAITAAAGPVSNFLLAFFALIVYRIVIKLMLYAEAPDVSLYLTQKFFSLLIIVNISLGVFNLLPIPPLDGSRILDLFLPPRMRYQYARLQRYSFLILMALIYTGVLMGPVSAIRNGIYGAFVWVVNLIPFLRL